MIPVAFERMTVRGDRGVCVIVPGRAGTVLVNAHEVAIGQRAWLSRDSDRGYLNEVSRYLGLRLAPKPRLSGHDDITLSPTGVA